MATNTVVKPLIVIVGPTASGKTALAIALAKQVDGEVICADSRTVYKGMDIGTAKPSEHEMDGVPHFGLDLVEPNERFTSADFQKYARQKIGEIRARGHVPIMVGGTGLYVDSVVLDYEFKHDYDPTHREFLHSMSIEELKDYCFEHNIELPQNENNKRHLIRAVELKGVNREKRHNPIDHCYVVGITAEKAVLQQRISQRARAIFDSDVVLETTELAQKYGWESEAMSGIVYRIVRQMQEGELEEEQAIEQFIKGDWHLAKRQITWFKRNQFIHWFMDRDEALKACISHIALQSEH